MGTTFTVQLYVCVSLAQTGGGGGGREEGVGLGLRDAALVTMAEAWSSLHTVAFFSSTEASWAGEGVGCQAVLWGAGTWCMSPLSALPPPHHRAVPSCSSTHTSSSAPCSMSSSPTILHTPVPPTHPSPLTLAYTVVRRLLWAGQALMCHTSPAGWRNTVLSRTPVSSL